MARRADLTGVPTVKSMVRQRRSNKDVRAAGRDQFASSPLIGCGGVVRRPFAFAQQALDVGAVDDHVRSLRLESPRQEETCRGNGQTQSMSPVRDRPVRASRSIRLQPAAWGRYRQKQADQWVDPSSKAPGRGFVLEIRGRQGFFLDLFPSENAPAAIRIRVSPLLRDERLTEGPETWFSSRCA